MLPFVSSAAALTPQQSSSLIVVVQSSPNTPASAFISLITAFSNVTTNQAASLITVIQAAPGVPANAFVNLLTSFTVDTATTQPETPTAPPVVITPASTQAQQATQTPTQISTSATSTSSNPIPAPEAVLTATKSYRYANQIILAGSIRSHVGDFTLWPSNGKIIIKTINIGFSPDASSKITNLFLRSIGGSQIGSTIATVGATNVFSVNLSVAPTNSSYEDVATQYGPYTIEIWADTRPGVDGSITAIVKADTGGVSSGSGNSVYIGSDISLQTITIQ